MRPDIYHIEFIGSGSLSVMAKPVAGEWINDEFLGIAESGIQQIVSLLEPHEAFEVGLGQEAELAEKQQIAFLAYPIPDRGLPKSIEAYLTLTQQLYQAIAGGLNTVIHCRAGIGRTGMVAAGVLLHCGYQPEDALAHISKQRGVQVPDTQEQIDWLIACHAAMPTI